MNWLVILAILILTWRIAEGVKKGMVKEIISFVSLIVLSLAVALLGMALSKYFQKDMISMAVAIILLLLLGIVHSLLGLVFFPAKLIAKLPLVRSLNKVLGAVIGILETILIIWTAYCILYTFETDVIWEQILEYVAGSRVLTFLYEHNYLRYLVDLCASKLGMLPL